MAPKRAMLLVNPLARSGADTRKAAAGLLRQRGFVLMQPPYGLEVWGFADYIRAEGHACDVIVVAGGDGTLSTCAKAISEVDRPLGILPTGTANDLARTLGIPLNLRSAADVVAAENRRRVDLGLVNGHPFFNVATIGLAADLAADLTAKSKRRFGILSYGLAALKTMLSAKTFTAWITNPAGEAKKVRTYQVAIGNGRHYGGGAVVHPEATIHDGHLDLYSLELKGIWKLAWRYRSFKRGDHSAWREVRTVRAKSFLIETRQPSPVNADGEIVTQTPARFEILPAALEVLVPKSGEDTTVAD